MLKALKRYRKSQGLTALPSPGDNLPIIPKQKGNGGIGSTRHLRDIVQACFDTAVLRLRADGMESDADNLQSATVHWIRHTGIGVVRPSPRLEVRPRFVIMLSSA